MVSVGSIVLAVLVVEPPVSRGADLPIVQRRHFPSLVSDPEALASVLVESVRGGPRRCPDWVAAQVVVQAFQLGPWIGLVLVVWRPSRFLSLVSVARVPVAA